MLNLETTDNLELVTDAAATVDVDISWALLNGSTVTAGATPTATTRADGPLGNAQQVVDGTVDAQWWRALRSPARASP